MVERILVPIESPSTGREASQPELPLPTQFVSELPVMPTVFAAPMRPRDVLAYELRRLYKTAGIMELEVKTRLAMPSVSLNITFRDGTGIVGYVGYESAELAVLGRRFTYRFRAVNPMDWAVVYMLVATLQSPIRTLPLAVQVASIAKGLPPELAKPIVSVDDALSLLGYVFANNPDPAAFMDTVIAMARQTLEQYFGK